MTVLERRDAQASFAAFARILRVLPAIVTAVTICCVQAFARSSPANSRSREADADSLFTNGALHVLKIDISRAGLRSLRQDPRKYVPATLREGPLVFTNAMVRLKGGAGSFRSLEDKPGLTINLGESGRAFHGLRKFHLNNSVQDPTYLSEWLCSEIFREAGVPAGRVAHAVVELNGRRLGLYVLLESINSEMLSQYFNQPHGNVYSLGANADVDGGLEQMGGREESHGAELLSLAAAARQSNLEKLRASLSRTLDIPRFLSFMAVEVLLDHWDGYTFNIKNYEVYHDPATGKCVFMPHDLDQVLRNANAPIFPRAQGMVARAILRDPETRAQYRQRFSEVFSKTFVVPALTKRIDARVAALGPDLKRYDPELARELSANSADLKIRIVRRAQALTVKSAPGAVAR